MRILLSALVLILSIQSWTKAADISDYEIEGISIGDSLFKHMNINEIIDNGLYDSDSKFFETSYQGKIKNFEYLTFHVKRNDPNYLIHAIRGVNTVETKNDCLNDKKEIVKDLKKVFPNKKFIEGSQKHYFYTNSTQYISQFFLGKQNTIESDISRVECVIMDKKDIEKFSDHSMFNTLELMIYTEEFAIWLENF